MTVDPPPDVDGRDVQEESTVVADAPVADPPTANPPGADTAPPMRPDDEDATTPIVGLTAHGVTLVKGAAAPARPVDDGITVPITAAMPRGHPTTSAPEPDDDADLDDADLDDADPADADLDDADLEGDGFGADDTPVPAAGPGTETASAQTTAQAPLDRRLELFSQISAMVAVLILGFLTHLTLFSGLQHARDQAQAYAELREALANAVAPVDAFAPGATDADRHLLAGGTPVAILDIPHIGVHEVVLEGTSARTTMSGPGHRRDTVQPGQTGISVIFGRRAAYGGPFGRLDQVRPGDQIIATTGQGQQTFTVLDVRRAGDPLPPALAQNGARLTLATADGPPFRPTDVLWVDANLTGPPQDRGTTVPSRALPPNEAALAGDPGGLLPLMLWLPLLIACGAGLVWVRQRVGRARAWVIGVPVLLLWGLLVFDDIAALLPNML